MERAQPVSENHGLVLERQLKRLGRSAGIEISRYRPFGLRRARRIEGTGIATVLDVGANAGQYGRELRDFGYRGPLISFEPLHAAFAELSIRAAGDPPWAAHRIALGDTDGTGTINVASNAASSSLLEMLPEHEAGAPSVRVIGTESVRVSRLDSMQLAVPAPAMLKLDVQGYEDKVLAGAIQTLRGVVVIECELSLARLYEQQPSFRRMIDLLADLGFDIVDLDPFFYDKTDGRVLAVDAMFERR